MRASPMFVRRGQTVRLYALVACALLGIPSLAVLACDSPEPDRVVPGRDEIVGPAPTTATDAQAPPATPNPYTSDAGSLSPYGVLDDAGYGQGYAYSPLAVCQQCACEAGTYCFGGGTGYAAFSGTCTGPGSAFGIGCQPLPAACASQPDCACLFNALEKQIPCYFVCSGVSDLTVYCPHP